MIYARIFAGKSLAACLFAATLAVCASAASPPTPTKIMKVTSASVEIARMPHTIRVCARGEVSTGGWSHPILRPRVYIRPPAGGIWEVDFLATPPAPGTIVDQHVTPIAAQKIWRNYPRKTLNGVNIGGVIARIGAKPAVCGKAAG